MYIPNRYQGRSKEHALAFMKEFNFALLLSTQNDVPLGTHLPFIIEETDGRIILTTHLAKANNQLESLENKKVLVVFREPHAYISPSLYESELNVPTWNYIAVHAYGSLQLINDLEGLDVLMKKTIQSFDPTYLGQYKKLPDQYLNGLMHGVVGLEINVEELQFKEKLSQNKSNSDRMNIIKSFEDSEDDQQKTIAKYMKQLLNESDQ